MANDLETPKLKKKRLAYDYRWFGLLSWLIALTLIAIGLWSSYWARLRGDQYQLIYLGQCVHDGGRMYIDCWENKPPGLAWLGALTIKLAGGSRMGAWILPGPVAIVALAVFASVTRRIVGYMASNWILILAAALISFRLYDTPSINPDFFSSMFALVGVSLVLRSSCPRGEDRSMAWGFLAGVFFAMGAIFKQTGVLGLLAVSLLVVVIVIFKRANRRIRIRYISSLWYGFAVVILAVLAILFIRGNLAQAYEAIITFNKNLGTVQSFQSAVKDWHRAVKGLQPVQLYIWLGALALIFLVAGKRIGRFPNRFAIVLVLWWLLEIVFALAGPSGSMRYWQATWPPMLWLAACAVRSLQMVYRRLRPGTRAGAVFVLVSAAYLLAQPFMDNYIHGLAGSYLNYSENDPERQSLRKLGSLIREHSTENQAIYVLGYDAGVYLHADRKCATRFVYARSKSQAEEIITDLEKEKAVLLLKPDSDSWNGSKFLDEQLRLRLDHLLDQYQKVDKAGQYVVYKLIPRDIDKENAA